MQCILENTFAFVSRVVFGIEQSRTYWNNSELPGAAEMMMKFLVGGFAAV